MALVPIISGTEVVKVLERFGWEFVRQSGSHMIMVKDGEFASLSIPNHREVAKGTLRGLIRSANLTVDQFVRKV